MSGGWGSEIIAFIVGEQFNSLKSAPFRITTPDVPVPFNGDLEARFLPSVKEVSRQIQEAISNNSVPKSWWVNERVSK